MSLFKILKGDSSRISTEITPFHDGWCYFTNNDGRLYIDAQDEDGKNQKRTCVNPAPYVKTFAAADWQNGTITIPASEHGLNLAGGEVIAKIWLLSGGRYSDSCLGVMDTAVAVTEDKSVILSYPGAGYAGKVVLTA